MSVSYVRVGPVLGAPPAVVHPFEAHAGGIDRTRRWSSRHRGIFGTQVARYYAATCGKLPAAGGCSWVSAGQC